MTHGGERPGAGRPSTAIDERRMLVLMGQGVTMPEIAQRFGVTLHVIQYRSRKLKKGAYADKR